MQRQLVVSRGGALSFDGVDDYVDISYRPSMGFSSNATVAAWVKSIASGPRIIFIKTIDPPGHWGIHLATNGKRPQVSVVIDNTQHWIISDSVIESDRWFHIVGVRDGTKLRLFVNGSFDEDGNVPSGPLRTGAAKSRIGRPQFDNGMCFNGLIDEVCIYNRALSESEIQQLYQLYSPPEVSNIIVSQRNDDSRLMDIHYDLSDAGADTCTISVEVSNDGGANYTVPAASFTGDIGSGITPGTGKHIIWDCKADLPGAVGSNYKIKVIADDGN